MKNTNWRGLSVRLSKSVFFCEVGSGGTGVCRPNHCCHFCWVPSKERPAKHRRSMCPSKSGWYEAWGLRPARETEGLDWLIEKLGNQHVTLSTAHCHRASVQTDFIERLQATGSHLYAIWSSGAGKVLLLNKEHYIDSVCVIGHQRFATCKCSREDEVDFMHYSAASVQLWTGILWLQRELQTVR